MPRMVRTKAAECTEYKGRGMHGIRGPAECTEYEGPRNARNTRAAECTEYTEDILLLQPGRAVGADGKARGANQNANPDRRAL
jgi:hypothetical protein